MTGMLASVTNLNEARLVIRAGADIIDLKEPANGALGALDTMQVREIRQRLGNQYQISATIGDLPMIPDKVLNAVNEMTATGVDFVKIGFFPGGDWSETIRALAEPAKAGARLVAVFFGDTDIDTQWITHLAKAGFSGAMIDTMNKSKGSLTTVYPAAKLKTFVDKTKSHQLLCGLAGSLKMEDILHLLKFTPDYLGFRGALCIQHQRTKGIDESAVRTIRNLIKSSSKTLQPLKI